MRHMIRAEYRAPEAPEEEERPPRRAGDPVSWHMVRGEGAVAMCGKELAPDADTRPDDAWGTDLGAPFCHTCGALYLREVP
ncbi:hypothetical protein GCM10009716_39550 [Streptomyces sodiiphilus]|uniref:Uncharacterized protein n=1 Tax=Streptomyces sodiiphilus TaxID=226217 RepID=A0ABN2PP75_9ACTN